MTKYLIIWQVKTLNITTEQQSSHEIVARCKLFSELSWGCFGNISSLTKTIFFDLNVTYYWHATVTLRACLHGGGGPQEGEVTSLRGVARLSI